MKQDWHSQIFVAMVKQIQDDPHRKSKQDLQQIAMINRKDRCSQKNCLLYGNIAFQLAVNKSTENQLFCDRYRDTRLESMSSCDSLVIP